MGTSLYQDRKYEVGQRLLTLRARTRLTQTDLAGLIGVNRRSIHNWEAGAAYPKEDRLQRLIAVFLEHSAFIPGREREEAEELWEQVSQDAPRPLPLFDVSWFEQLRLPVEPLAAISQIETEILDTPPSSMATAGSSQSQRPSAHQEPPALGRAFYLPSAVLDWGEAIDVPTLYGRDTELATLQEWVLADRCRVVALLGLGGIGKTSLALTLVHAVASHFEAVFFRSLRNAPLLSPVLDDLIRAVSGQQATLPDTVPDKIALLVEWLRQRRCLLILDNLETTMQARMRAGDYRANYADYGRLIQRLGESAHQSCLLLTSREKPMELGPLEGRRSPVRTLVLRGLDESACYAVLEDHELSGVEADWATLAHLYGGNPLALKLVSEPIREIFGGDIAAFLQKGDAFFNGVGQLLEAQLARSTPLEQALLLWLAIARDLTPLDTLLADLAGTAGQREGLQALESLRRRYLIERAEGRPAFTLQPVILEYMTDQLVEAVHHELVAGQPKLLRSHALVQATAKEYVRHSQERLIARPLLERLVGAYSDADALERRLLMLLASWREQPHSEQGYGPGNVINLLRLLRGHLRGLDLAHLAIRQAYLAEVDAQDARLVDAYLADTVLAEAFHFPSSVALSGDGALLVAGTSTGQVWLWRVADRTPLWAVQGHTGAIRGVALSADGRLVASGGGDGMVRLWEAGTGWPVATLQGHTGGIRGVALSADGHFVASSSFDGTVRLWDANAGSGRPLATLQGHTGVVWGVALSADGHLMASGGDDGMVKLWEASSGRLLASLSGHTGVIGRVALSADGHLVASGGDDGIVKLWEASSGRLLATLSGHTGVVWGVALSSDGRLVASGSFDGTVRLWEAKSGACLRTLRAERRYERMDISGLLGITAAQRASFIALGAVEQPLE
ncbi:MAG: NACHT domain-containing protein [Anaerolineales bacterium]|nr:NACHT domain-containing protein [Anaerolineales bacterium]